MCVYLSLSLYISIYIYIYIYIDIPDRGRSAKPRPGEAPAGARRKQRHAGRRKTNWKHASRSIPPLEPDPAQYEELLAEKVELARERFAEHLDGVELEVVRSPPLHHRHRMRSTLYRNPDGTCAYKMLDPESLRPVPVYGSPYASEPINGLMPGLLRALDEEPELREGLIETEFISNSSGEVLIGLFYGQEIGERFGEERLTPLAARLGAAGVVATYKKLRVHGGCDHLVQHFEVAGCRYPQVLQERCFSQHNLSVCQRMLEWAAGQAARPQGGKARRDLLELYCGNGNFTLPLAGSFRRVLATERDKRSSTAAQQCASRAGVENLACVRLTAEEMAQALLGVRPFRRLAEAGIDLGEYDFGTVFVNPPRAGLSKDSMCIVQGVDRILYVSCSPRSLLRDLRQLRGRPEAMARAGARLMSELRQPRRCRYARMHACTRVRTHARTRARMYLRMCVHLSYVQVSKRHFPR